MLFRAPLLTSSPHLLPLEAASGILVRHAKDKNVACLVRETIAAPRKPPTPTSSGALTATEYMALLVRTSSFKVQAAIVCIMTFDNLSFFKTKKLAKSNISHRNKVLERTLKNFPAFLEAKSNLGESCQQVSAQNTLPSKSAWWPSGCKLPSSSREKIMTLIHAILTAENIDTLIGRIRLNFTIIIIS